MSLTKAQLLAEIDSKLPTNHNHALTAAVFRDAIKDVINNSYTAAERIETTSGTAGSTTFLAGDNVWRTPPSGGTFSGTGDPGITRALATATTFTTPPAAIRTIGYLDPGDQGGGLHVKVNSTPAHPGYFPTQDGSLYELIPENGCVTLPQFGGRTMTNRLLLPTVGGAEDNYAAFLAADKYMQYHLSDLIVPDGSWFLGRAMNYNRASYRIIFRDAEIRISPYEEAFITLDYNTLGRDYIGLVSGMACNSGQGFYKASGFPGAGNCYRCVASGTTSGTDTLTNTANDPATTYTWGGAQFRFEKFVGPGSVYDYNILTEQFAEMEFINPSVFSFWGTGGGGVGADTDKWPDERLDASGEPQYSCGIILRHRGIITNPQVYQVQGFGVAAVAAGDFYLKGSGNVDGWRIEHLVARFCGKAGFHNGLAIANAGKLSYADTSECGRAGLEIHEFLGSTYDAHQSAYDGVWGTARKQYQSGTLYNGHGWACRAPIIGIESWPNGGPHSFYGEEPGNPNNHAWTLQFGDGTNGVAAQFTGSIAGTTLTVSAVASGAVAVGQMISTAIPTGVASTDVIAGTTVVSGSGTTWTVSNSHTTTVTSRAMRAMGLTGSGGSAYPDWNMTRKYEPAGAFVTNNNNAANVMTGFYIEGGTWFAQPCNSDILIGGSIYDSVDKSRGALVLARNYWNYTEVKSFINLPTAGGKVNDITLGGFVGTEPVIWSSVGYDGVNYRLRYGKGNGADNTANKVLIFEQGGNANPIFEITLNTTVETYGRTAALPNAFAPFNFMLADRELVSRQRRYWSIGGGPPSAGEMSWKQGDMIWNANVASGSPMCWGCSADGDPGTWKAGPNWP